MLTGTVSKYREAAYRLLKADPNVRQAIYQRKAESAAALTARRGPKTAKQEGAAAIERLGKGFGVNLNGMVPEQ